MKLSRGSVDPVGTGWISSPVLKCQSGPGVIPRPFRIDSEPQPSQPIIYVRFDRANAIEPLRVDVKCTYHGIHLGCPLGGSGGSHLPSLFKTDATHAHSVYR